MPFDHLDPATQYVIAAGIVAIIMAIVSATVAGSQTLLMYYLSKWKEQRQNERADEIERKADERAERLAKAHKEEAGKVAEEVKAVKTALTDNPPLTSADLEKHVQPIVDSVVKIEEQTNGMKDDLVKFAESAGFREGVKSASDAAKKTGEMPKSNKGE